MNCCRSQTLQICSCSMNSYIFFCSNMDMVRMKYNFTFVDHYLRQCMYMLRHKCQVSGRKLYPWLLFRHRWAKLMKKTCCTLMYENGEGAKKCWESLRHFVWADLNTVPLVPRRRDLHGQPSAKCPAWSTRISGCTRPTRRTSESGSATTWYTSILSLQLPFQLLTYFQRGIVVKAEMLY
jgi:hypothetical protein